jgi:hypothetical protein
MPGYVEKALRQFQHKLTKKQSQLFPHTPVQYGQKKQYAKEHSTALPVDAATKKFIQKVCGQFLYYARAIDSTLLTPLSAIALQSATPTEDTLKQTQQCSTTSQ